MSSKTKRMIREAVMGIAVPLFVSILIGVFVWYTNTVANAEQDRARSEKIEAVEINQESMKAKIDKIAEDVSYIRGLLSR